MSVSWLVLTAAAVVLLAGVVGGAVVLLWPRDEDEPPTPMKPERPAPSWTRVTTARPAGWARSTPGASTPNLPPERKSPFRGVRRPLPDPPRGSRPVLRAGPVPL